MWHEFLRLLLFLLEIGLFVAMFVMYWESLTQVEVVSKDSDTHFKVYTEGILRYINMHVMYKCKTHIHLQHNTCIRMVCISRLRSRSVLTITCSVRLKSQSFASDENDMKRFSSVINCIEYLHSILSL